MSTIPASQIVNVIPNVLSAGGNALDIVGVMLTTSDRVPIGAVLPFTSAPAVAAYFGASSNEATQATVYFNGFDNSSQKPGKMYVAQYPAVAVSAYLRSGNITAALTLAQLQALTGTLIVSIDGYVRTASALDLSSATSFSAAATLIQTGLNASIPTAASVTGAIAAGSASFTGSIAGTVLTVTGAVTGTIAPGGVISGTGVTGGTTITSQLSGTAGGAGTYGVSVAQTVASTTISETYGTLTVSAVGSGTISVGQTLSGSGVTASTVVTGLGTGTGLTGTYYVNLTQTAASTTITAKGTPVVVTFDSVSGAFIIASGITGAAATAGFATGTLAATLLMTSATGAVTSQGSAQTDPNTFMNGVASVTQDWATFWLNFDPDYGSGNAQKLAFVQWTNSTSNRFAFVCWDTDASPTVSVPATGSLGALIAANNYSGTILIWEPSELYHAAFACGWAASIDFSAHNGRTTLDFRGQTGLAAAVTVESVWSNLLANGYNCYGAFATANEQFLFMDNGSISGPFLWADSYINQIWLNNQLQLALMVLLTNTKSIPFNQAGYALVRAAIQDPINQALDFGAIRAGVTLSAQQAAEINNAAGAQVAQYVQAQGWYLQIADANPQDRAARKLKTPLLWYTDGQSVQRITLTSIEVQ
jgi:hypothetical protein